MPLLDDTWIPDGSRIIVACSGGGDSVALLHLLAAEAAGRDWDLTVAHLDHGLRPSSVEDARFTTLMAEELGLKCVTERRKIATGKNSGENTESAARRIRYDFLSEVRDAEAPGGLIATGHTLDDQLETIALRLERGAGLRGQRGILPRREDDVIRPLLGTRRDHLRQWLTGEGLEWREDESNLDHAFRRNLWRSRLGELPGEEYDVLLEEAAELAHRSRVFHGTLHQLARWWTGRSPTTNLPGEIMLRRTLGSLPPSAFDQVILETGLENCGLDATEVPRRLREALLRLWFGGSGSGVEEPGESEGRGTRGVLQIGEDIWAERVAGDLMLARCRGPHWERGSDWHDRLDFSRLERDVSFELKLPEGGTLAAVTVETDQLDRIIDTSPAAEFDDSHRKVAAQFDGRFRTIIDMSGTAGTLGIRYGRSGDMLQPFGMTGRKHLADLFIEERVPRLRRGRLPVIEAGGTILWVAGVRMAEQARVGPDTRMAVTLQFSMSNT
ncbi:tRNA lysidine(34) synthetase TilS [Gemmatimonadota bacterium]